jgi:hypothetical protein
MGTAAATGVGFGAGALSYHFYFVSPLCVYTYWRRQVLLLEVGSSVRYSKGRKRGTRNQILYFNLDGSICTVPQLTRYLIPYYLSFPTTRP